jgi:Tol biopolymer transport system component
MGIHRHGRLALLGATAALTLAANAGTALAVAPDTLIHLDRGIGLPGLPADGHSEISRDAVSADGRYVAFTSAADGLVLDDNDANLDAFVRDLQTGTVKLVSRKDGEAGAHGAGPPSDLVISDDGKFVAFSTTEVLEDGDANGVHDVFVRDLTNDTTELVSRPDNSTATFGDSQSYKPTISADGSRIAFYSTADNLDTESDDFPADVFVRDTDTDDTILASRANGAGGAPATGFSDDSQPAISADGSTVAFGSSAMNLSNLDDDTGHTELYLRNIDTNTTTFLSLTSAEVRANGNSHDPAISANGRYIAFESDSDNVDPAATAGVENVYVRDVSAGTTTLASRANGATGVGDTSGSVYASISNDGRYVSFDSSDDDLNGGVSAPRMVYVRDLVANTTGVVSRRSGIGGALADDTSAESSLLPNGDGIAFESTAENLITGVDTWKHIYLRGKVTIPAGPGPQLPQPTPPTPPVNNAPNCSSAKLAKRKFRPVRKGRKGGGTKLSCTASEAATLTVTFLRQTDKRGKKFKRAGSVRFKLKAGKNTVKLTGVVKRKRLLAGKYKLKLDLKDSTGLVDKSPATLKLTIAKD